MKVKDKLVTLEDLKVSHDFLLDQIGTLQDRVTTINSNFLDKTYPIGSIYMSVNSTDPQTLFGGTWERIQDKFLLSAGTSYKAGITGGEATHTLSSAEMPTHTHSTPNHTHTINNNGSSTEDYFWALMYGTDVGHGKVSTVKQYRNKSLSNGSDVGTSKYTINTLHNHTMTSSGGSTTGSAGGNSGKTTAHNNMPPYLTVYVWKRTA